MNRERLHRRFSTQAILVNPGHLQDEFCIVLEPNRLHQEVLNHLASSSSEEVMTWLYELG